MGVGVAPILQLGGASGVSPPVGLTFLVGYSTTVDAAPTLNSDTNVAFKTMNHARIGDKLHVKGQVRWSGAGPNAQFYMKLPGTLVADLNKMFNDSTALTSPGDGGSATWLDAGNALFVLFPRVNTADPTQITLVNTAGSGFNTSNAAANDQVWFDLIIPIVGWTAGA